MFGVVFDVSVPLWLEKVIHVTTEHNHLGDSARVELKRLQGVVQNKAVLSKEAPRSIVADCIAGVSEEAKPLVRRSLLARNIRSIRNEENLEPANPKNLNELLVPNEYKILDVEEFLEYDGWNNDERILIFHL
uniref:Protein FAR1-RELATED SEQUENCE n=1 Tax=Ditylenchus dipsaci TaxID=166011 RepID=A0A915E3R3_9BILA